MSETTMWRALNSALHDAMTDDPSVFVLGEDLTRWATGGGVYGVTRGLRDAFGAERVRDTPISEEAIIGAAVGAALCGFRPVAEIMSSDFSLLAFDPIVNQAAKARYMFGGQFDVPLVLRSSGGTGTSRAAHHTQSLETIFAHVPGLEVVLPAFPNDARGLLRSAIRSPNPTIFLEQKSLYTLRGPIDDQDIPLGRASVVRSGRDVTVIATQLMVHRALAAAASLELEGIELEIVDLRTLYPLDLETVFASARRTRRVLVCHEAPLLYGFGAELAASVSEACWNELDAPVARLGAAHAPVAYAPILESALIPSESNIEQAARSLCESTSSHSGQGAAGLV